MTKPPRIIQFDDPTAIQPPPATKPGGDPAPKATATKRPPTKKEARRVADEGAAEQEVSTDEWSTLYSTRGRPTSINLPPELRARLEAIAEETNTSLGALMVLGGLSVATMRDAERTSLIKRFLSVRRAAKRN